MRHTSIYLVSNPLSGRGVYLGKTQNLSLTKTRHTTGTPANASMARIAEELRIKNMKFSFTEMERCKPEEAQARYEYWLEKLSKIHPLTNKEAPYAPPLNTYLDKRTQHRVEAVSKEEAMRKFNLYYKKRYIINPGFDDIILSV